MAILNTKSEQFEVNLQELIYTRERKSSSYFHTSTIPNFSSKLADWPSSWNALEYI